MKLTIKSDGKYQAFEFEPSHVDFYTTVHASGLPEHYVLVQDPARVAVAFCRSRKAANSLSGAIRYETLHDLYIGNSCLALGVLVHPAGWPNRQDPVSFFARVGDVPASPGEVHVPASALEVFPPLPKPSFSLLETIPSVPYRPVLYQDVRRRVLQGSRIVLNLKEGSRGRPDRIIISAKDAKIAEVLERDLAAARVEIIRVNHAVKTIIREIHPTFGGTKWEIDGFGNLDPQQKRALERIGLITLPNGSLLTQMLAWEHARMLTAVQLF